MKSFKAYLILVVLAAIPTQLMRAADRYEITRDQIAAAINERGIAVESEQVVLLTDVVAASKTPKLQIQSVEHWGPGRLRVRCTCTQQTECVPFFVSVKWNDDTPMAISLTGASDGHKAARVVAVRSGSAATLLIDDGHAHIQMRVICLENGAAGSRIRVASMDRQRTFTAEVVSAGLLKGSI